MWNCDNYDKISDFTIFFILTLFSFFLIIINILYVIESYFQGRTFQLVCADNTERIVRAALYSFKVVHTDKIAREFVMSAQNYSWYNDNNENQFQRKCDIPILRFLHCLLFSPKFTTTMMNLTPGRSVDSAFYKSLPKTLENIFGENNIQLAKNIKYPF